MTLDELINRLQEERRRLSEDVKVEIEAHSTGYELVGEVLYDPGDNIVVITQDQIL